MVPQSCHEILATILQTFRSAAKNGCGRQLEKLVAEEYGFTPCEDTPGHAKKLNQLRELNSHNHKFLNDFGALIAMDLQNPISYFEGGPPPKIFTKANEAAATIFSSDYTYEAHRTDKHSIARIARQGLGSEPCTVLNLDKLQTNLSYEWQQLDDDDYFDINNTPSADAWKAKLEKLKNSGSKVIVRLPPDTDLKNPEVSELWQEVKNSKIDIHIIEFRTDPGVPHKEFLSLEKKPEALLTSHHEFGSFLLSTTGYHKRQVEYFGRATYSEGVTNICLLANHLLKRELGDEYFEWKPGLDAEMGSSEQNLSPYRSGWGLSIGRVPIDGRVKEAMSSEGLSLDKKESLAKEMQEAFNKICPELGGQIVLNKQTSNEVIHEINRLAQEKASNSNAYSFGHYYGGRLGNATTVSTTLFPSSMGTEKGIRSLGSWDSIYVKPGTDQWDPNSDSSLTPKEEKALESIEEKLKEKTIGCLIIEPLAGYEGVKSLQPRFLKKVRDLTEFYKIPLVLDETLTFARTGTAFFFQQMGIVPDYAIVGKCAQSSMLIKFPGHDFNEPKEWSNTLKGNSIQLLRTLSAFKKIAGLDLIEKAKNLGALIRDMRYPDNLQTWGVGFLLAMHRPYAPFFVDTQHQEDSKETGQKAISRIMPPLDLSPEQLGFPPEMTSFCYNYTKLNIFAKLKNF